MESVIFFVVVKCEECLIKVLFMVLTGSWNWESAGLLAIVPSMYNSDLTKFVQTKLIFIIYTIDCTVHVFVKFKTISAQCSSSKCKN